MGAASSAQLQFVARETMKRKRNNSLMRENDAEDTKTSYFDDRRKHEEKHTQWAVSDPAMRRSGEATRCSSLAEVGHPEVAKPEGLVVPPLQFNIPLKMIWFKREAVI